MRSVRSAAVREVVEFNKKLALQRRQNHSTFLDKHTQVTITKLNAQRTPEIATSCQPYSSCSLWFARTFNPPTTVEWKPSSMDTNGAEESVLF